MEVKVEKFISKWNYHYYLITAAGRKFIRKSAGCAKTLVEQLKKEKELKNEG